MRRKQRDLDLDLSRRRTCKAVFLAEMERLVPWAKLAALIEPHALRAKTVRPRFERETMLRIHFLQQWFGLNDVAMEEALFDVPLYRQFAGLGGVDRIPDGVSILRFRHLLERHELAARIFATVSALLAERGLLLKTGTAVNGTVSAAPSSTGSGTGTRAPEMVNSESTQLRTTKRGNQWHFGMTSQRQRTSEGRSSAAECGHERSEAVQVVHIRVGADSGLVHALTTTLANAHDMTEAHKLLHGQETGVFAESGYRGAHRRQDVKDAHPDISWHVTIMPGKRRKLDNDKEIDVLLDELERIKAQICSKIERPSRVIKRQFGHVKVRYWGLKKNTVRLCMLLALVNLWMVRRRILQQTSG